MGQVCSEIARTLVQVGPTYLAKYSEVTPRNPKKSREWLAVIPSALTVDAGAAVTVALAVAVAVADAVAVAVAVAVLLLFRYLSNGGGSLSL